MISARQNGLREELKKEIIEQNSGAKGRGYPLLDRLDQC